MNLDELFDETARLGEPALPGDVLGGVREAQARRRRAQLLALPVACLAVAGAVLVPTVLLDDSAPLSPASPPTPSPTVSLAPSPPPRSYPASPEPTALVGISGTRAFRVDVRTEMRIDLGAARAVTTNQRQTWVSRPRGECADTITPLGAGAAFDARGRVNALQLSPDGRSMAYSRATGPASTEYPSTRCTRNWVVIRDLRTGAERQWSAGDGHVDSLTWSADGRLAFAHHYCCGDFDPGVQVLETSARPADLDEIPTLPRARADDGTPCITFAPVFSGTTLLAAALCSSDDVTSASLVELQNQVDVTELAGQSDSIAGDVSGRHLLIADGRGVYTLDLATNASRRVSDALSGVDW